MSFHLDVVHVGPQKSATTWLYEALKEHPEIAVSKTDAVHYFDIHFTRGPDWYKEQFPALGEHQRTIDFTPTYIRSPFAAERISRSFPDAKIIVCVRDPIERAFSHYWHEKKKRRFNYNFDEVTKNYDLFQSWIEPGFYAFQIRRYLNHFPRKNILIQRFEHLSRDADSFLQEACNFCGISSEFKPSVLDKKVNAARAAGYAPRRATTLLRSIGLLDTAKQLHGKVMSIMPGFSAMEKLSDIDGDILKYLAEMYNDDMRETEKMIRGDG